MAADSPELTLLLRRWAEGEAEVEDQLAERIYPFLHRLAARQLRGEGAHPTFATTELAHEAYLDLFRGKAGIDWQDRRHFLALAARVVRRVVVDHARHKRSLKRGGDAVRVDLAALPASDSDGGPNWLAIDGALRELGEIDAEACRVVELRFFAGMNAREISETCSLSTATISRRWRFARAWLRQRLEGLDIAAELPA